MGKELENYVPALMWSKSLKMVVGSFEKQFDLLAREGSSKGALEDLMLTNPWYIKQEQNLNTRNRRVSIVSEARLTYKGREKNPLIPLVDTEAIIPPVNPNAVIPPVDIDAVISLVDGIEIISPVETIAIISPVDTDAVIPPIDINALQSNNDAKEFSFDSLSHARRIREDVSRRNLPTLSKFTDEPDPNVNMLAVFPALRLRETRTDYDEAQRLARGASA
ncbi:hypothetical protein EVAR_84003_1 [Eumeta japonica]|uniref:Uncharacterized protein n=1 Tax=Eumeta variegata TaxID=151549 RepID=A0A4C1X4Z9_EUMVA|nr:hypothetical protein EVAR_84003_1 [Eumeta japonica]